MKKNLSTYNPTFITTDFLPIFADGKQIEVTINPSFDQGFSKEGSDIICYRRNYFSVTTSVTFHSDFQYSVYSIVLNGQRYLVKKFKLEIEASSERDPILISFFNSARERLEDDHLMTKVDINAHASGEAKDVSFRRMQFQSSTPSGSKGAKKYIEFAVKLLAVLDSGEEELVAISISEPFLIRGMSPKYYSKVGPDGKTKQPKKIYKVKDPQEFAIVDRIAVALSMERDVPDTIKSPESFFGSPNTLQNSPTLYPGLLSPYDMLVVDPFSSTQSTLTLDSWTSPTSTYAPMSDFDLLFEENKDSLPLPQLLL
ncbi:hypothetical protein HDV04_003950 [Boothiomyces sp. JEL0838]|nr:hypothetical protein HDV04_003950 [Boothiomyces sp. JEL0838]